MSKFFLSLTLFFSLQVVASGPPMPEPIKPIEIVYRFYVKKWDSNFEILFRLENNRVVPYLKYGENIFSLKNELDKLNVVSVYPDDVYMSCDLTRTFDDCASVHLLIKVELMGGALYQTWEENNNSKHLYIKLFKKSHYEVSIAD